MSRYFRDSKEDREMQQYIDAGAGYYMALLAGKLPELRKHLWPGIFGKKPNVKYKSW